MHMNNYISFKGISFLQRLESKKRGPNVGTIKWAGSLVGIESKTEVLGCKLLVWFYIHVVSDCNEPFEWK